MTHTSARVKRAVAIAALAAALCAAAVIVAPWMQRLYDPALREKFISYVDSLGAPGYALMFGLQILQVIVAIIPGEPVELMAGVLCGGPGGLVLCLAGSALASAAVFALMRRLGPPLLDRIFRKKRLEEYGFMRDSRKLELVTLILFLMPATPKDMLTYVAGTTPLSMHRFLIISTLARIPSVASSTFIGDSVLSGRWHIAIIIAIITIGLGLIGIFFREPAMAFCRRHSRRRNSGAGRGDHNA